MSRTYRYKHDAYIWKCFFSYEPYCLIDGQTGKSFVAGETPLTGKAKATSWSRWRADGGYRQLRSSKMLRKIKEGAHRIKSRKALRAFMHHQEYEIQLEAKPRFGHDFWSLV